MTNNQLSTNKLMHCRCNNCTEQQELCVVSFDIEVGPPAYVQYFNRFLYNVKWICFKIWFAFFVIRFLVPQIPNLFSN